MREIRALLLAGGMGTRLKPFTDIWPKCLMPIGDSPLLEYWLQTLKEAGIKKVMVNLHHHPEKVRDFLFRSQFKTWVDSVYEENLLGTAGTLLANKAYFQNFTTLLVHADNWSQCEFSEFIKFHQYRRPKHCPITMMTFKSPNPQSCGIVQTDELGIVMQFHEKVQTPPGNLANGAVYLLEPEVLEWLEKNNTACDFSTEVIPNYLGRIATWYNSEIHMDIGEISFLRLAQSDIKLNPLWYEEDEWQKEFLKNSILNEL